MTCSSSRAIQMAMRGVCRAQQAMSQKFYRAPTSRHYTSSSVPYNQPRESWKYIQGPDRSNVIGPNYEIHSPYPDIQIPDISITDYCFQKMHENCDSLAFVNTDNGDRFTWGDIKDSVIRVASGLTKLGYTKGDVMCIFMENSPEYTIMFLAMVYIGGIVTTANPRCYAGELRTQLGDSNAKAIFIQSSLADVAKEAAAGNPQIRDIISVDECADCVSYRKLVNDNGRTFPDYVLIDPDKDVFVIPYSSGTTGLPKGVMLTHKNVISNIYQLGEAMPFHPGDRVLCVLPLYHIYGLVVIQFSAIRDNVSLHTMSSFEPVKFLERLQNEKISILNMVPPMVIFLAKDPAVLNYDLSQLRIVTCGAASLGSELTNEFKQRFPNTDLIQGFGMTETSPVTHVDVPPGKPGTVGCLVPNVKAKVIHTETGENLGPGQLGELCVKGPQVMKGYLRNQEATDNIIQDGWLHTGDIAMYDEEGVFTITERLKELIKYKGFQVAPAELEALLLTHPDIQDAGVIGIPDEVAGEVPRAFVVLKPDKQTTETEIKDFVADAVTQHKKLRGGVTFVKEIPKSPSGKILRRILRESI